MRSPRQTTSALLAAALLAASGCGGDDDEESPVQPIPAAGENTPPSDPSGASYEITGNEYLKLSAARAVVVASDYVADNRDICKGADPTRVADYASATVGNDFPLTEPIGELLAEGCAAELQSG